MADRGPVPGRHFERATAARGSVARGKRPQPSLRTAPRVLSAAAKIEPRRCVVACESSDLRASRRIRLDHESGGFRIDFDLRKQEWRSGSFLRNPGYGAHLSILFESGRRIQRKESAIRSQDDRALSRLAAKQSDYPRRLRTLHLLEFP